MKVKLKILGIATIVIAGSLVGISGLPAFSATPVKKSTKKDGDHPVVLIKDGVRTVVPFSKTNTVNPDSIESISVNNDTMFIQLKSIRNVAVKKTAVKSSTPKKK